MPIMQYLSRLRSRVGTSLSAAFAHPYVRRVRALLHLAANAGTAGYPSDVRRRLKILNMMAYLIAATTLLYAVQQTAMDFNRYAPMIFINVALVIVALLVPFAHRISEIAGGLML